MWMNEYEIEDAFEATRGGDMPNFAQAAQILCNLKDWTNQNSDGWPYWQKPAKAANKLMELVSAGVKERYHYRGTEPQDITETQLKSALRPVKAFLTREGVDHSKIFG